MRVSRQVEEQIAQAIAEGRAKVVHGEPMPTKAGTERTEQQILDSLDEKEWMSFVVARMKEAGYRHYHVYDSRKTNPGWPDEAFWKPGIFLLVEFKTNEGKLMEKQVECLESLREARVMACVWRPKDWPYIKAFLASAVCADEAPTSPLSRCVAASPSGPQAKTSA